MFLKKEKFTWQKESLIIFELSALQRIELPSMRSIYQRTAAPGKRL
ncbi:TPA: phage minor tail protein G [Enterobacter kobei]